MNRDFLKEENFEGTFPFKPHYKLINGFQMHYIDEGEGEPILCLHGMPTWSYLYRKFIKRLSKYNRIIAPDQMGFGKSDVPENKNYVMEEHVSNLKNLVLSLDLDRITLIVQDWGGPVGFAFAVDYPEKIKNLIIMNTSIGVMKKGSKPWYKALEDKGIYEQFIMNIEALIKSGIHNKNNLSKINIEAYKAPFPDKKYFIGAFAWPKDIPVGPSHPSAKIMKKVRSNLDKLNDKNKILIWGLKDPIFPPKTIQWWEKIYPGIEIHKIESASHFLQEDAPDEIIEHIEKFLKKLN